MKLRQEARVLKRKALSSLVTATEAFNSPRNEGRATRVLLHLQHSFEMLLKAALVQAGVFVFDSKTGRSLGFESCVCLAMGSGTMKLSEFDAGTLRAIDAMRDDEQHWFNEVPEQLLYLHIRAGVTLFDDLLQQAFDDRLADHLPARVLPVSADPPKDSLSSWTKSTGRLRRCLGQAVAPGIRRVPAFVPCWRWRRTSSPRLASLARTWTGSSAAYATTTRAIRSSLGLRTLPPPSTGPASRSPCTSPRSMVRLCVMWPMSLCPLPLYVRWTCSVSITGQRRTLPTPCT